MIDAHQHFWDHARNPQPWITPDMAPLTGDFLPADLAAAMAGTGVTQSVLVQATHRDSETDWYLDLAERHAFIAGVVGWVDLTSPGRERRLDELMQREKFRGVRHVVQGEPEDDWIIRPGVLDGLASLERRGLTYDLLLLPRHLKHLPTLAARLPDLKLVLDHLGKPPIKTGESAGVERWRNDLAAAAEYPNVCCKLSGMVTEADHDAWTGDDLRPYVQHAVACFGPDRLMFGSDWPVCLLAAGYPQVLNALREALGPLDETAREAIFAGTARRFYGLTTGGGETDA